MQASQQHNTPEQLMAAAAPAVPQHQVQLGVCPPQLQPRPLPQVLQLQAQQMPSRRLRSRL